jgi:hypothetical protein
MISVILPSRARPDLFETCARSLFETAACPDTELCVRLDVDDPALCDYACLPLWGPRTRALRGPRLEGYDSIPEFLIELARGARGDLLFCLNDDVVFRTPGWDVRMAEAAARYPDGIYVIATNDLISEGRGMPFHAVSRRWVDALGFLIDPRVFWGDVYMRDVGRALGRLDYLEDVIIEHVWARDRRAEASAQEPGPGNAETHWAQHALRVADAVERLRPLMSER